MMTVQATVLSIKKISLNDSQPVFNRSCIHFNRVIRILKAEEISYKLLGILQEEKLCFKTSQ